jgi:hypothetical protein
VCYSVFVFCHSSKQRTIPWTYLIYIYVPSPNKNVLIKFVESFIGMKRNYEGLSQISDVYIYIHTHTHRSHMSSPIYKTYSKFIQGIARYVAVCVALCCSVLQFVVMYLQCASPRNRAGFSRCKPLKQPTIQRRHHVKCVAVR